MFDLHKLLDTAVRHPHAVTLDRASVDEFTVDFVRLLPLLERVFGVEFLQQNLLFVLPYQSILAQSNYTAESIEQSAKEWRSFFDRWRPNRYGVEYEELLKTGYEYYFSISKPKQRKAGGVWYTPDPVVSYMCRSLEVMLQEKFDRALGLADADVDLLDPACGIGCYLTFCFRLAVKSDRVAAKQRYLEGHFRGIDIDLMACYLARLNMEFCYKQEYGEFVAYRAIRCGNALELLGAA